MFKNFLTKNLNKLKTFLSKPANAILLIFLIVLVVTVLIPLILVVRETFLVHITETMITGKPAGTYVLDHWKGLLFTKEYDYSYENFYKPLLNSIYMGLLACLVAISIGGITAFLMTRTNIPFKKFISIVFIFPYIMPSWSIAMFWENFFKNSALTNTAGTKGTLEMLTGICVPGWAVYGLIPCAICLGIHYAPFAYILIGGILKNMDSNLEEAAQILNASRLKIIRKITIPIVLPAIVSTILLVFASSVSSYTVPMMLGSKGGFWTLSLKMKSMVNGQYVGQGYVIGLVLIVISVIILMFNQKVTGTRKSYVTVSGKSSQISTINLGKTLKWVVSVILVAFVSFFAIFPMLSFALESFLEESGNLSSFTFKYWISTVDTDVYIIPSKGLLLNPPLYKAIGGSLLISTVVSLFAGTFGILIGYGVTRKRGSKIAEIVSSLAFLPYLIPAMSFGIIYMSVSTNPLFSSWLYESILLLIIVGSVKFLPFASRGGTNAMLQISSEIEESAIILGIPWYKRMLRIIFPIQKSSFISGYLLPFISCMRELSLFVLIAGTGTILTSLLTQYQIKGLNQMANGLNLIIIVLVLGINLIINKVTGASIDKGVGGR
ncbi:MAG: iron ABC transporter permease [Acholeplasmatales bacterium]|jgi:iron(III) transport system permease protein|nr:iron ABC transporter permease [Acholeplasmatales bacterium]